VNSHANATFLLLNLKSIDPLGNYGDVFYKKILRISRKLSNEYNISIFISGLPAASMDAIDAANGHFMGIILFISFHHCGVCVYVLRCVL
jgi:hypothetical protein